MRRLFRYFALLLVGLSVIAGGVAWWAYDALREIRPFYRDAMSLEPSLLRKASDELTSRAMALVNDARQGEPWRATFSEDQINGWLAVDLPENHPELIPRDISDPRLSIEDRQVSIGARYHGGRVESVLSVDVEPYLREENVLALRILGARAGTLPVPLREVTQRMNEAAAALGIPISWIQEAEDPTALIRLQLASLEDGRELRLETFHVSDGQFYLGGIAEAESEGVVPDPEANGERPAAPEQPQPDPPLNLIQRGPRPKR